jgi:hypothetical protein
LPQQIDVMGKTAAAPSSPNAHCKPFRIMLSLTPRITPMAEREPDSILDIPPDAAREAAADAAAEAEIDAGKGIPHAAVRRWLESWGKPDELPCPLPPE